MKDFFSKYDQIRRELRIWSHLLKKSYVKFHFFYAAFFCNLTQSKTQNFYPLAHGYEKLNIGRTDIMHFNLQYSLNS